MLYLPLESLFCREKQNYGRSEQCQRQLYFVDGMYNIATYVPRYVHVTLRFYNYRFFPGMLLFCLPYDMNKETCIILCYYVGNIEV